MSTFVNWLIDTLASDDVIDLYFILSDLVDIPLSEAELCETAYYDALATQTMQDYNDAGRTVPIGKLVI